MEHRAACRFRDADPHHICLTLFGAVPHGEQVCFAEARAELFGAAR